MRRLSAILFFVVAVFCCWSGCGGGSSTPAPSNQSSSPTPISGSNATIDFGNVHQTIRGFGGSDAWIGLSGAAEANVLFGTGSGQIGLSILRMRIDPSSTTPGSQWDAEVANAKAAIAAGSNVIVFASPWTPPVAWKINYPNPAHPDWEGSLDSSHYADYANYLQSYVTYVTGEGINLYAISMQNEPDFLSAQYESCQWTPAQMDAWVSQLPPGWPAPGTRFMMPESFHFDPSYSDPALNDVNAASKFAIIGGHIYGTAPAAYPAAVSAGKELWMTEHSNDPPLGTFADAMNEAKELHDSLTVGQYNAYVWWWVSDVPSLKSFIGLIDANNNIKPAGAAMAQFARFIRPGYVRVDASATPTSNVYVSAYKGGGHFVIVAINMNSSAVAQPFTIQNQSITSLVPYQTTASATVAQQSSVGVSGTQFTYTLPAQSITTFVQ